MILFNTDDPQPLIGWLVDTFGLQTVLGLLSNHLLGGVQSAPAKRVSKKGGGKKRGRPKGSKSGGKKRGRNTAAGGGEAENG